MTQTGNDTTTGYQYFFREESLPKYARTKLNWSGGSKIIGRYKAKFQNLKASGFAELITSACIMLSIAEVKRTVKNTVIVNDEYRLRTI